MQPDGAVSSPSPQCPSPEGPRAERHRASSGQALPCALLLGRPPHTTAPDSLTRPRALSLAGPSREAAHTVEYRRPIGTLRRLTGLAARRRTVKAGRVA